MIRFKFVFLAVSRAYCEEACNIAKLNLCFYVFQQRAESSQAHLVQILLNSPKGLSKEDLIEQVWHEKYDPSMDSKLYKLIQRIRENSKFEIVNQNQCYYLRKPTA